MEKEERKRMFEQVDLYPVTCERLSNGRSGFEVLEWIRQQPQLRRVPVVVFSSSNRPDDIARAYDTGANGFLVKPNALADLRTLVLAVRDFWLLHNRFPDPPSVSVPEPQ